MTTLLSQVEFFVHVDGRVREDTHSCKAKIVCGTRVMELTFVVTVTSRDGVGKAAAMAAAALARERGELDEHVWKLIVVTGN